MNSLIRRADVVDVPALVELGMRFSHESPLGEWARPDPDVVENLLRSNLFVDPPELFVRQGDEFVSMGLHMAGVGFVAVVNDQVVGLLLLMTRPSYFSNLRHAEEVAWWVSPEYRTGRLGIKLLRAAQEWCSHSGVDVLQMSAPAGSSTGEFLRRDGFTFVEEMHLIRIQRADVAVREQDAGSDQRQPEDGGG